jgi:hypothetical protein
MTVVVVGTGVVLVVKLKDEVLSVSLSQLLTVLQHVEFIQLSDVTNLYCSYVKHNNYN